MEKIHNNLTIENLIKTEHFKKLNRYKKEEILINTAWFNNFDKGQQREIKEGLENNLDISFYAKYYFDERKMGAIRLGLLFRLDVSWYAKKEFNWPQMDTIFKGLSEGLDVSIYAKPEISAKQMIRIKEQLSKESTL